jgi:hypothetical protein
MCKGECYPGSRCPGLNSVQGDRDGKPPGKPLNVYADRVSELEEFADSVASLSEIGCGSMAVNYCNVSEEEIIQDVLRKNPEMLDDI